MKGFAFIVGLFLVVWSLLVFVIEVNTFINLFIGTLGLIVGVLIFWIGTQID